MKSKGIKLLILIGVTLMIVNSIMDKDYIDATIFTWSAMCVNCYYEYREKKNKGVIVLGIVAIINVIIAIIDKFV